MGEWVEGGDWRLGSRRLAGACPWDKGLKEKRRGLVAKVGLGRALAQRIGRDQPDLPDRIRVGLVLGGQGFFPVLPSYLCQVLNHNSNCD
jgi:hypothetical protein